MSIDHEQFMMEAIRLAVENIGVGGGPFGAVITRNGQIVGRGANRVTANNDPTAHAEVMAIRDAASTLGTYNLSGCTIYTSCEPCPMCLGAIYWARLDRMFYGCTQADAQEAGFDDSFIYQELAKPLGQRTLNTQRLLGDRALEGFNTWRSFEDRVDY